MSLLRDIQEAAGNFNTPLQVALHHCMTLADRLGPTPFREWVEEELSGYPVGAKLPAYRRIRDVASIGNFGGPLGAMEDLNKSLRRHSPRRQWRRKSRTRAGRRTA